MYVCVNLHSLSALIAAMNFFLRMQPFTRNEITWNTHKHMRLYVYIYMHISRLTNTELFYEHYEVCLWMEISKSFIHTQCLCMSVCVLTILEALKYAMNCIMLMALTQIAITHTFYLHRNFYVPKLAFVSLYSSAYIALQTCVCAGFCHVCTFCAHQSHCGRIQKLAAAAVSM